MVKNHLPMQKMQDMGLIPGSGRSFGTGNGNPLSSILAWKIPWTEEPDRLQSMGSQKVGHYLARMQAHTSIFKVKESL